MQSAGLDAKWIALIVALVLFFIIFILLLCILFNRQSGDDYSGENIYLFYNFTLYIQCLLHSYFCLLLQFYWVAFLLSPFYHTVAKISVLEHIWWFRNHGLTFKHWQSSLSDYTLINLSLLSYWNCCGHHHHTPYCWYYEICTQYSM